ncbi:MAG TPA: twin-arginine translocase TatA/TatE family subunit [Gaiellaceae bacterium]|nr:twin-arginine translocase TatA/TatE family subunit [Gaiellaceae bacterium]
MGGISLGGLLVIIGIIVAIFGPLWLGIVIALIGLIAFGGFARGRWY